MTCQSHYQYYMHHTNTVLNTLTNVWYSDGFLRPIKGVIPIAITCKEAKLKYFILPEENAKKASTIDNIIT